MDDNEQPARINRLGPCRRFADFDDATYVDFLMSAAALHEAMTAAVLTGVGRGGGVGPASGQAVGAAVAGVDLLPGPDGEMYVIEVNAVPGWRALVPVSGVDVAVELVRFLADRPDV